MSIDQGLCTGDGLCEKTAPDVFVLLDDGLAYVREGPRILADVEGNPQGPNGMACRAGRPGRPHCRSDRGVSGECTFIEP